jgi:hypothetical protein
MQALNESNVSLSSRYARLASLCRTRASAAASQSMVDGLTEMALAYERRSAEFR